MWSVQRWMVAFGVVAVAGFGSVSGSEAKSRPALKVAPASPTGTTPITVSFKAPKLAPKLRERGMYYGAELSIDGRTPECSVSVALRAARGGTFTATLKPRDLSPGVRRWCNGPGRVEVRRYGPWPWYTRVLAAKNFPVGTGKSDPLPAADNLAPPVTITVLGGSTLTASAAGRPDRSTQLTGVLRGTIPPGARPTTDVPIEQISGSLTPQAVFPPDPLCPDASPPGTFDAVPASSQMLLKANGDATFTLVLNGAASQLFGCGPAGALNGTTTLPLTGRESRPKDFLEVDAAGSVTGIPLPNGSQGGLAASLVLNVDLSGKG